MSEFKVMDVRFLTPALVTVESNGGPQVYQLSIDLANRKVYSDGSYVSWGDKVFEHLDSASALPEDFFVASDEVHERASEAFEEALKMQDEHLSEASEESCKQDEGGE